MVSTKEHDRVMQLANGEPCESVVVIAGFNGLKTANVWINHLIGHSRSHCGTAYSWRHARCAAKAIAESTGVTLIGHSLGAGFAQLIAEGLPAGKVGTLITVAPFAPQTIDIGKVREKVGSWLNIVSAPRWHDPIVNLAGRSFMGWRDQGAISSASENYFSRFPHQDFYRMMSDRCGRHLTR